MDGSEHPDREPGRRTDLSGALAWRRRPVTGGDEIPEPNGAFAGGNGTGGTQAGAAAEETPSAEDTWTPPEPWSPPEWSPPVWGAPPAASSEAPYVDAEVAYAEPEPAASANGWARPESHDSGSEIIDAEVVDEVDYPSTVDQPAAMPEAAQADAGYAYDTDVVAGAPVDVAPVEVPPADMAPVDTAPVETAPVDTAPAEEPVPASPLFEAPAPAPEASLFDGPAFEAPAPYEAPEPYEAAAPAPHAVPEAYEPPTAPPGGYRRQDALNTPTAEYSFVTPRDADDSVEDAVELTQSTVEPMEAPEPSVPEPVAAAPEPVVVEPAEEPVAAEPVVEQPVVEQPVAETPVMETPVMETPMAETPVVEEPVAQTPVEEPVVEGGMAEPPLAPAPMTEASPVPLEDLPPIEAILPPANGYREVGFDTVARSVATDSEFQPYRELGLQPDEYARIRQILGRRPTESELAMYAVMWSEHCSYKSSKVHLRQFGEKAPRSDRLMAGIGANAGVIRVSDHLAVTFKVESHNHPSFVEPYQGAATGVGGIVRDILAMGARPVAIMDPLRFGAADHDDTRRVLPGVVAGIGGYGNCLGLPNIGGEVVFDECYQGNPLVNALCVGVLPIDKLQQKAAYGVGNIVVLIGAKTGRDGIGGVSVLASSTFGQGSETRRPSVQVGDPFLEKLLIEACLEIYDLDLVAGIQDLGGAGLTCALTEMSAAAGLGMSINLDLVPLREPSMRAEEVLASESQERMMLVVTPENLPVVLSICARWGVLATAIGEVTPAESPEGGRLRIWWRGEVIVDVPPGSLADDGPVYARPMREPFDRELMKFDRPETLPRPETPEALRETVLRMAGSPNLCDKGWVTEQYDRYVQGNTVLAQPEDSGIIRIDESTGLGVALSVDGNGRYSRLDPYTGAKLALAEAYRNVAVTGAIPVAVTNCLNFGSPEDPGVMWQFAEAVRGLADGCAELGIPVTGGNVSFYNQTGGNAINPTPVVGVLGILDNVARRVPMGFSGEGDAIFLLGQTREEIGGSEWAHVTHRHLGGAPPAVDLAAEQRLGVLLAEAASAGLLTAAHDLSEGGLAQALVESCLRRNVGAHVALPPDGQSAFVHLFSESAGRAIVSVRKGQEQAFVSLADARGVPRTALGIVEGHSLNIDGLFEIGLDELRRAHTGTLPALFD